MQRMDDFLQDKLSAVFEKTNPRLFRRWIVKGRMINGGKNAFLLFINDTNCIKRNLRLLLECSCGQIKNTKVDQRFLYALNTESQVSCSGQME